MAAIWPTGDNGRDAKVPPTVVSKKNKPHKKNRGHSKESREKNGQNSGPPRKANDERGV